MERDAFGITYNGVVIGGYVAGKKGCWISLLLPTAEIKRETQGCHLNAYCSQGHYRQY